MNADQIGAVLFAAAALIYLWRYESPLLQDLHPLWRILLLWGGSAVIAAALLHYLGIFSRL